MISAGLNPGNLLNMTDLGAGLVMANIIFTIISMRYVLRGNVAEVIDEETYSRVVVAKIIFAVILSQTASTPASAPLVRPFATLVELSNMVGGGYFIVNMVLDIVVLFLLRVKEFYYSYRLVVFNLLYIPLLTPLALAYAILVEQRRAVKNFRDVLPIRRGGVVIGMAVEAVRVIQKPVKEPYETHVGPHIDMRPLPQPLEVYYKPEIINEKDFNPHMLIAGISGSGKTTTIYQLSKELSRMYPVILIDVKGDITRALLSESANAFIVPVAQVGLNPFEEVWQGEPKRYIVDRLIDSISVVEEVGSRQRHFIREAYAEMEYKGIPLKYGMLLDRIVDRERHALSNDGSQYSRMGPGAKDALVSISSKLKDLGGYLRDDGVSIIALVKRILEGRESDFPILTFDIEGIDEKSRAIVLEFILRIIANYLYQRGPLSYLKEKQLVLIVDEAYLVTRPMRVRDNGNNRSILEEIARAGRSYGVALILVTQRISDIADGIRQNVQTWVCFTTSSPEDKEIIGDIAGVISRVVSDLAPGEAYIRVPNRQKLKKYKYAKGIIAVTEGYIFKMVRNSLPIEKRNRIDRDGEDKAEVEDVVPDNHRVVCYKCMLLVSDQHHCPTCGTPPLRERPKTAGKNTEKQESKVGSTLSTYASQTRAPARVLGAEKIRRRAAELHPDKVEDLNNLRDEYIIGFIDGFKGGGIFDVDLYVDAGLVKKQGGGRIRPTGLGKAILDGYEGLIVQNQKGGNDA